MKHYIFPILASTVAATVGFAATDGTLGATSTGSVTITATVPQPANPTGTRISGLQDMDFGSYDGRGGTKSIQFCLYHSSPTATLTLTQPTLGDQSFRLLPPNPGNDSTAIPIVFELLWPFGTTIPTQLTSTANTISATQFNRDSVTCENGGKTTLTARLADFGRSDWGGAAGATYSGAFQLVISTN